MTTLWKGYILKAVVSSAQTKGSGSPVPSVEEPSMEKPQQEPTGEPRPSTPPTRPEAFEDFKKGRGSEINKILLTNKGTHWRMKNEQWELKPATIQWATPFYEHTVKTLASVQCPLTQLIFACHFQRHSARKRRSHMISPPPLTI